MDMLLCFKCKKSFAGIKNFTSHFRRNHGIMVSRSLAFGFYCRQQKCNKHFLRYDSLIRHLKKYHIVEDNIFNPSIFNHDVQDNHDVQESETFLQLENTDKSKNVCCDEFALIEKVTTSIQSEEILDISSSAMRMVANLRSSSS